MKQGVYSLPLLLALQTKKSELEPILRKKEAMTDYDVTVIEKIIHETDALTQTKNTAQKYTEKALSIIRKLPENDEKTKDTLADITKQLLNRIN